MVTDSITSSVTCEETVVDWTVKIPYSVDYCGKNPWYCHERDPSRKMGRLIKKSLKNYPRERTRRVNLQQ